MSNESDSSATPNPLDALTNKQRREYEYGQFLLDLLDDRHSLEMLLRENYTKFHRVTSGYAGTLYQIPTVLSDMFPPGTLQPRVDVAIVTNLVQNGSTIEKITLSPEDSQPIVVRSDEGIMVVESAGHTSLVPTDTTSLVLRGLLPAHVIHGVDDEKILSAIELLSPQTSTTLEFQGDTNEFHGQVVFTQTETADDSVHHIEIIHTYVHPSSAVLGTRLSLLESLNRRREQRERESEAQHGLTIDAEYTTGPIVTVEDLFADVDKNKSVDVAHPTQRHMENLLEVLELLRQAQP